MNQSIKDKIEEKFRAHISKAAYGSAIDIRRIDYTSGYDAAATHYEAEISRLKFLLEATAKAGYSLATKLHDVDCTLQDEYWADYCKQNNI